MDNYFIPEWLRVRLLRLQIRYNRISKWKKAIAGYLLLVYLLPDKAYATDFQLPFLQKLIDAIFKLGTFLKDVLLWVPKKVWSLMIDGALAAFNALPTLPFLDNLDLSGLEVIGYFIGIFRIPECVAVYTAALTLRFVLRRIPFIG